VAACCLESELRHEARKRGAKFQLSIPGSNGFSCHPDEDQAWIAAIGQAGPADIGDEKGEIAVRPNILGAGLFAVRKRSLDQELRHEAERAGIEGALGGNDLNDGLQGVWLPGGNGTFSRANRVEPRG